jgi:predicted AlkP superfamily pyrophosphatase or phosphodiesterase
MRKGALFIAALLTCAADLLAQKPHVVMISLDGMKPEYVTQAKEHNLHLPVLERFLKSGTYAEGVIGVIPTVTYPSHSTMVTGVWPAQHGVYSNLTFDPVGQHPGQWYWNFRYLKTTTLYQAADKAGLTSAAISWPVTVGAPIDYLIAEYAQSETTKVPPGDLVKPVDLKDKIGVTIPLGATEDEKKTAWSVGIINTYNPNFVLIHLAMLDHQEHEHSPFSPQANEAVEKLDGQVGRIMDAELRKNPNARIVIVSDHGFVRVDHHVPLNNLLVKGGFISLRPDGTAKGNSSIASWQAEAWESGGTAAIMLHDASDAGLRAKIKHYLDALAADPQYGINKILTRDELRKGGGYPDAAFLIDFKPGWSASAELSGDAVKDAPGTGTHGYLPDHPELRSTFMVLGAGVAKGRNLGVIDMRQIAPSVARMLNVELPDAKLKPVHYELQD